MLLVGLPGAPKPHAGEDLQAVDALFEWCTHSHTMICICGQPLQSGGLCICRLAVPCNSFNCKLQLAGSSFLAHTLHARMRMRAQQADSHISADTAHVQWATHQGL